MLMRSAGSVSTGMARLRRAGGPDIVSRLPYALIGDRLTSWLGDASEDTDAALADALGRLTESRGEIVTAAGALASPASDGGRGRSGGQATFSEPFDRLERPPVDATTALRRAGERSTAADPVRARSTALRPAQGTSAATGLDNAPATARRQVQGTPAAASPDQAHVSALRRARGTSAAAAPDEAPATALREAQGTTDAAGPSRQQGATRARGTRGHDGGWSAPPVRVARDPAVVAELNRLTARGTPVVADPGAPRPVATAPTDPLPSPVARRTPTSALPPVGLAGLAAWWADDGTEPDDRAAEPSGSPTVESPSWGAADSWPSDQRRPEPDAPGLFDLTDVDADPLGRFREALEQVLLDEALADGLEVTDGPA